MKKLITKINRLKGSEIQKIVNKRIKEFEILGKKNNDEIFKEMCFCLLTANYNAQKAIDIQKKVDNDFLNLNEPELANILKNYGHRFPNMRAKYINEARKHKNVLKQKIKQEKDFRKWLVDNVKGLGLKESSHFMRNIGFKDVSIIDFHIIDLLVDNKIINKPKTLTKKKYYEIENVLKKIAQKSQLNLAELDLYLWYIETNKVLK